MPDDLLEQLDARAAARGTTRSGLLQELARAEVAGADAERRAKVSRLLAEVQGNYGGRSAEFIRRDRDRDDR